MKHRLPRFLALLCVGLFLANACQGVDSGTITVCDDVTEPVKLDPHLAFDNKVDSLLSHIYEGLVKLSKEGKIAPSLAERWERVDERSMRFFLRSGVRFHNGEPFNAEAVRNSLLRELKSASSVSLQIASIEEIVVESSEAVVIRTREPDGALLHKLAAFARIVSSGVIDFPEDYALEKIPAGTGPFRLIKWDRGDHIVLESNPNYWRPGFPRVKQVIFQFLPAEKQIEALSKGDLDLVTDVPGTRTLEVARQSELRLLKRETMTVHAFWFTSLRGPLANVDVRRALNMALDKEKLIRYAARGNGKPVATLSSPGEIGHNDQLKPYPYDPARAKSVLEKEGWPKDFKLRIFVMQQSENEAKVIKGQLHKIGVDVELTTGSLSELPQMIQGNRVHDFDLFANLAADPVAHMYFLSWVCFHSRSPLSAGRIPGFDERYDQMMKTENQEDHERLARELDAWIYDQALALFTYQRIRTYGMRQDLKFQPHVTGMLNLEDASWEKNAGNAK